MDFGFSRELRAELLNDFYVESDEHLGNLREHLSTLENTLGHGAPDPATVQSLFRSMHSFKGIAAMCGLVAAERLAHAAEDFLRLIARRPADLTISSVELLLLVTQRLEQVVTCHRLQKPAPEVDDLLAKLVSVVERHASSAEAPQVKPSTHEPEHGSAPAQALNLWHATFAPSRELDARGVNINSVRSRLGTIGQIVSATPTVRPGGSMTFEFEVAVREIPADLEEWTRDGIVLRPAESRATAEPPVAQDSGTSDQERTPGLFIAPSHLVRVDLSRLDELMQIAGEMVIHRARLDDRIEQLGGDPRALKEVSQALARSLRQLRTAITRVRLVPVAEIFTRMPFVVRDLARDSGRQVRLVLEGHHTELDKYLIERLKEPLLHLVRNAFSHGVESPEERQAAGKPREATITLRAKAAGEFVLIQVRDDGRGVDPAQVAERAAALGLSVPAVLDEAALLQLLCTPGFSTRAEVDRASGRGVGMSVVSNAVRELGGSMTFSSTLGQATEFTLRLPLTLSIAETIIVSAGDHTCAVPQGSIDEIIQISETDVRTIKKAEVVPYREGVLPLLRLHSLFGSKKAGRAQTPVLVLSSERGSTGLVVDRVISQREIVVRPMQDPLLQVPGISGATELGDGRPVLILDPLAITNGIVRPQRRASTAAPSSSSPSFAS